MVPCVGSRSSPDRARPSSPRPATCRADGWSTPAAAGPRLVAGRWLRSTTSDSRPRPCFRGANRTSPATVGGASGPPAQAVRSTVSTWRAARRRQSCARTTLGFRPAAVTSTFLCCRATAPCSPLPPRTASMTITAPTTTSSSPKSIPQRSPWWVRHASWHLTPQSIGFPTCGVPPWRRLKGPSSSHPSSPSRARSGLPEPTASSGPGPSRATAQRRT